MPNYGSMARNEADAGLVAANQGSAQNLLTDLTGSVSSISQGLGVPGIASIGIDSSNFHWIRSGRFLRSTLAVQVCRAGNLTGPSIAAILGE